MTDTAGTPAKTPGTGMILLLAWLGAVGWIGGVAYVPALPEIARDFGATEAAVQVTLTAFITAFALTHLIYGPMSDRYGRRNILLVSLVIYVVGSIAVAVAPTVGWMTGARVLQAFGAVGGIVLARAIARDVWSFDQVRRPLALINSVGAMAPVVAFAVGGLLAGLAGWRGLFWLVAAISLLTLVLAWIKLPESHTSRDASVYGGSRMVTNMLTMFRLPLFWAYTLAYSWIGGAIFAFMTGAPFIVIGEMGVSAETFGLLVALMPGGFVTGSVVASRLVGRLPPDRMMIGGTLVSVAIALVLLAVTLAGLISVPLLFGSIFLYTFGMGIAAPNTMAGALEVRPQTVGAASALLGFSQLSHSSLASFLVSRFDSTGGLSMAGLIVVFAVGSLGAAITAAVLQRRHNARKKTAYDQVS